MELELLSHQDAGYSCVNVDRGQRIPLMELPGLKESDFWTFPKHIWPLTVALFKEAVLGKDYYMLATLSNCT